MNGELFELTPLLAALSSVVVGAIALTRKPGGGVALAFAFGTMAFAAESAAAYILLTRTEYADERLLWLRVVEVAGLVIPVAWSAFVALLCRAPASRIPLGWVIALVGCSGLAALGISALSVGPAFDIADVSGPFYAVRLDVAGRYVVVAQLVETAVLVAMLEAALRSSRGISRWRSKYLVLGLGAVFLVRFYLQSQVLLFSVLMGIYLTNQAATLGLGCVVVAAALFRSRLAAAEITISRQVLYRSVVIGVLGLYLFTIGALGWLLNYLGVPEQIFWGSLAVFVSALALAAVFFSEDARWRIKRFIALHFYRSKYDYREQWIAFTKRLGSLLTVEDLAPQFVQAVAETVGATKAILYLADDRDGRHHRAAAVEARESPASLGAECPLLGRLGQEPGPVILEAPPPTPARSADESAGFEGGIAVPLRCRGDLIGVVLLGPERTGTPYTLEDLEFMATVGEQAAIGIVTARLSQALTQAREFDAFHRLTSFVIHDLKNSISALSMLSQNALAHFDDPEFQRDALRTLSRTVDRMKMLLSRLSSAPGLTAQRADAIDLAALAVEATAPLKGAARVTVVTDLSPAPTEGDHEALLKVIQNLVNNATEAIAGEGLVTVRTYEDGGFAVLSVGDTGCGMSEDFVRTSLFAPFRSTKKSGWGIGLYHAKSIVEAHGGRIDVATKLGEGSTFSVTLPARTLPAPGNEARP